MKYFVTGTTGFLGTIGVRQLISQGHQVIAIFRDLNKVSAFKMPGVQLF